MIFDDFWNILKKLAIVILVTALVIASLGSLALWQTRDVWDRIML